MTKIGVVVLADTETHGDLGRVVNALETAKEAQEAGDEVQIIFDGAGTKWPAAFSDPEHKAKPLYDAVQKSVTGACEYCAGAFGVKEKLKKEGIPLLAEYDNHPSLRPLVVEGYQVITF